MNVKFFGQFLVEQGEIDAGQLREAIDLAGATNRTLGEIAVAEGLLSVAQSEQINAAQRYRDLPFGELATEMGLLDENRLEELVRAQRDSRLPIGRALVELGALADDQLGLLLDQFKQDQAAFHPSQLQLPDGLSDSRLAHLVVDLLPRLLHRMGGVQAKLGLGVGVADAKGSELAGPQAYDHRVGLVVVGFPGLRIGLFGDHEFARGVAGSVSGIDPASLDSELVADGVAEFLNVLAGNAMAVLEREGVLTDLEPPQCGYEFSGGYLFELAVTRGEAALHLALA